MPSNPNQDPRHRHSRGHNWRIQRAHPAVPNEDVRRLSLREERDLHFNGDPRHDMQPLHELCSPGGCRYKSEAENCADLEGWYLAQQLAPGKEDPEAEL